MMGQLTTLFSKMQEGDAEALDLAIALVYSELRLVAKKQLARDRPGHILQPTALVHEVYDKLHGAHLTIQDKQHFLGICARAMRQILVDDARRCRSLKGKAALTMIDTKLMGDEGNLVDVIAISDLMQKLEKFDERKCRLAELMYFGGLTQEEAASVMGISERTVRREMVITRAWILSELTVE